MKVFATFFLFLLTFFLVNQNVFAQDNTYKYGNVIYQLPSGYRQDVVDSTLMLVPRGQTPDNAELAFVIAPGIENAPGDLPSALHSLVTNLEVGREVIKRESSTDSVNGMKVVTEVSITKVNNEIYIAIYMLSNPGGRAELLALITTNPKALDKYQRQIGEFFGTISFANLNETYAAQNNANSRNNIKQRNYSNSSRNQQLQRNRTNTNQIFLNSIGNNYSNLSKSF